MPTAGTADLAEPDRPIGDIPRMLSSLGWRDERALAAIAVERTRMAMVITDPRQPENPIVMVNQAYLDLLGYGADELDLIIGRNPRFMQGEGTDPVELSRLRNAIAEGRDTVVELANYRRDGSVFWNQLFISPVHDDHGKLLYYFGSLLDVTRKRDAERLKMAEHRLLREVDHRAKNALALVQGIVRLSRSDDPAAYARTVQERVDVLARIHGLLAEGGWADVGLDQIVRGEVGPYGRKRVTHGGPFVPVPVDKVQPLALLLHEMLANAAEHGALARDGEVTLEWRVLMPEAKLELGWRERGGDPPAEDRRPGFGMTMIRSIAQRQLAGTIEMDFGADGLDARISFPLASRSAG